MYSMNYNTLYLKGLQLVNLKIRDIPEYEKKILLEKYSNMTNFEEHINYYFGVSSYYHNKSVIEVFIQILKENEDNFLNAHRLSSDLNYLFEISTPRNLLEFEYCLRIALLYAEYRTMITPKISGVDVTDLSTLMLKKNISKTPSEQWEILPLLYSPEIRSLIDNPARTINEVILYRHLFMEMYEFIYRMTPSSILETVIEVFTPAPERLTFQSIYTVLEMEFSKALGKSNKDQELLEMPAVWRGPFVGPTLIEVFKGAKT